MAQEEKQLLLKDICGRLPYGVMVENVLNHKVFDLSKYLHCLPAALENFKPYLRPMSSMTEEERQDFAYYVANGSNSVALDFVDWCNAHHFDYRGLIGKGLALVAPEDMYTKEDKQ